MRNGARVQHRPLLRQVLTRRQPCRVEPGSRTFVSAIDLNMRPTLVRERGNRYRRSRVRPRAYVRVQGPDAGRLSAADGVERRLAGEVCEALLLTPKARVIAPLVVWRRGDDDFLLLTEPELGDEVRAHLHAHAPRVALRDRARGAHVDDRLRRRGDGIPTPTTVFRRSRCSTPLASRRSADEELERLRDPRGTPRWGREIDDRILPPRPASTSAPSRSRRAAIQGRSRSRVSATAAT